MGKKGKNPKGRAGAKKKAQKGGSANSSPWQNGFVRSSNARQAFDDDEDDFDYKGFRGFAQNNNSSPRNFTPQNSNVKLRHQAISFVAAGTNTPVEFDPSKPRSKEAEVVAAEQSEEEVFDPEQIDEGIDESTLQTNIAVDTDVEVSEGGIAQMNLHSSGEMSEQDTGPTSSDVDMADRKTTAEADLFVVDTAGDEALGSAGKKASGKKPVRRRKSPSPSESSDEEVVVFHGRGKPRTIEDPVQSQPQKPAAFAQQKAASPRPPHPDPVAAWKTAARSLPQQYNEQANHPVAKSAAPREDSIKETFKKTSGSKDRLGGPRQYEVAEHTVHDATGTRSAKVEIDDAEPQVQPEEEQPHVADDLLKALSAPPAEEDPWSSTPKARGWGAAESKADRDVNMDATWAPAPAGSWWKNKKSEQARPDLDLSAEEKAAIDQSPPKVTKVAFAEPGSSKQAASEILTKPMETSEQGAKESIDQLRAAFRERLRDKKRAKSSAHEADVVSLGSPKGGSNAGRRKRGARKKDNRVIRAAIESDDDDDDAAGEAAYDDYMANLAAQLENGDMDGDALSSFVRSTGLGGPSMVVDGQAIGDGEVLKRHADMMNPNEEDWETDSDGPIGLDTSDLSEEEVRDYDEESDDSDADQEVDSSELEDELEHNEREMWEDEEDLRQRRKEEMEDEHLARLIAKQQEFGYGDDDLVLDDGFGMEGIGDVNAARVGLANMTNVVNGSRKNKSSRRSGGRRDPTFPDASALADSVDQYGDAGFDIMDFDRPSLRPTKKGRKGKLPAELEALSDDEMKENMSTAWENDRAKKRLKKAEREELRSQGMLGAMGKKGKADLDEKYKYQDGMSNAQILEELKVFLKDEGQESRPFPPMDKFNRKRLHEIASQLNLKSKSVGAGKTRFPVLYKTPRTVPFDERLFQQNAFKDTLALNVKFSRRAKRTANKGPGGRGGGKGGGGMAAASVGHGEIVGANAPEMGTESKGFRFMQKMGWTPGMSLGREGEGRLVPVEQMMRVGRAGLG